MNPREIDVLVAEHVLGIKAQMAVDNSGWMYWEKLDNAWEGQWSRLPHYSTDISAAWKVVEKMLESNGVYDFGCCNRYGETFSSWFYPNADESYTCSFDKTAPMAICLAALAARGVKYDKE